MVIVWLVMCGIAIILAAGSFLDDDPISGGFGILAIGFFAAMAMVAA